MLIEEGWPVLGQVQNTQTPTNTDKPVPLALHPNFAPLRCAKLRVCPIPLCKTVWANTKDNKGGAKK